VKNLNVFMALIRHIVPGALLMVGIAGAARSGLAEANAVQASVILPIFFGVCVSLLFCVQRVRTLSDLRALPAVIGFAAAVGRALLPGDIATAMASNFRLDMMWDSVMLISAMSATFIAIRVFRYDAVDVEARLARTIGATLPLSQELVPIVAKELALFYYALFSWWTVPEIPPGGEAFSVYRRSTDPLVLWVVLALGVVEIIVLHLIISHWSPRAAWIVSDFGIVGLLFILGTIGTLRLRPAVVTSTEIMLSLGILKSICAPIAQILDIRRAPPNVAKSRNILRTCLLQPPNVIIEFTLPIRARTMYSGPRPVTSVAAYLDSPTEFIAAVKRAGYSVVDEADRNRPDFA
jgi:hypothetical protein